MNDDTDDVELRADLQVRTNLHLLAPAVELDEAWRAFEVRRRNDVATPAGRGMRWRSRAVALAAAAVVVAATIVVVRAGDTGDPSVRTGTSSLESTTSTSARAPADPAMRLLPTALPAGWQVWRAETTRSDRPRLTSDATSTELFRPEGVETGGVLLATSRSTISGTTPNITVRGTTGHREPGAGSGAPVAVQWQEDGPAGRRNFVAAIAGVDESRALAFLDSLDWAADPARGLQPKEGSGWISVGAAGASREQIGQATMELDQPGRPAHGRGWTFSSVASSSPETWVRAQLDGVTRPDGGVGLFDGTKRTLWAAWPDGRTASIEGVTTESRAAAQELLDHLQLTSVAPRQGRWAGDGLDPDRPWERRAAENLVTLPVLATIDVPSDNAWQVRVVGDGEPEAACLFTDVELLGCVPASRDPAAPIASGTFLGADGDWFVMGVADVEPEIRAGTSTQPGAALSTVRGSGAGWQVRIASVPTGIDHVAASRPLASDATGGNGRSSSDFTRPGRG